jgi:hypothetical protein
MRLKRTTLLHVVKFIDCTLIGGNILYIIKDTILKGSFSSLPPNPFIKSNGGD